MEQDYIIRHIKELLEERGWSVYRLAKETNLPTATLYNLFRRKTSLSFFTLNDIVHALGITMADFFAEGPRPDLTEREQCFLQYFNLLDKRKKKALEAYLDKLLEENHPVKP